MFMDHPGLLFRLMLALVAVALGCGSKSGSKAEVVTEVSAADLETSGSETVIEPDVGTELLTDVTGTSETLSDVVAEVSDVPAQAEARGETWTDALDDSQADGSTSDATTDAPAEVVDPLVASWPAGTIQAQCGKGVLGVMDSPSGELAILVVRGSHYEMGYQVGCLVGAKTGQFFGSFLSYYLEEIEKAAADMGLAPEQTAGMLYSMVSNIWEHVAPFVPASYLEEMQGFEDAILADPQSAAMWGDTLPAWGCKTLVLLSNISDLNWSGSIDEVIEKLAEGGSDSLQTYYNGEYARLMLYRLAAHARTAGLALPLRTSCSFFAAWGDRTVDGHLMGSRNLDWSTDTGISTLKGVTIYAPDDGYAHAAIGYVGFPGALAGMSETGIILSEVGSESVMERLKGQPWTLKFREIMKHSADLETAVKLATGEMDDGQIRPTTIGYNWMVGFGDPPTGAAAQAAALETNGVVAGVYHRTPDCQDLARLVYYDAAGKVQDVVTSDQDPWMANKEADAVEVDAKGEPRLFAADENGQVVLGADGCPATAGEDLPFGVGRTLPCTLFRGDEALMHGVRMWQTASHGPQGSDKLLCNSGSYVHRYVAMYELLSAFENGTGYEKDGIVYADKTGEETLVGLLQAEKIARLAAMGSNVMSIAYDATALTVAVSYETGTGPTWQAANKHDYYFIDLKAFFALLKGG